MSSEGEGAALLLAGTLALVGSVELGVQEVLLRVASLQGQLLLLVLVFLLRISSLMCVHGCTKLRQEKREMVLLSTGVES